MDASQLHVVTAIVNPMRWTSRVRLYRDFEQHMLDSGVSLTVVECAHGERAFELSGTPHVQHIPVRAKTMVWTKENLLNIGITRLPGTWQYAAWIDADIVFRRPDWAVETLQTLQLYDVVQPWSDCHDLGPRGEHLQTHRSFCRQWINRQPVGVGPYTFAHPGYAWAATRHALNALGGLIETAALGAADHHMALALTGAVKDSVPAGLCHSYSSPLLQWQERAERHIARNIGYVSGTIEHAWHGPKAKRRYVERWDVLARHAFDPSTDLIRNVDGVLELAGNKPGLRRDIDSYLRGRDEDSNALGD